MVILETERLILRRLKAGDAPDLFRIYGNARVMEFMGPPPASVEQERLNIEAHIRNYYDRLGYGFWATILKENRQLIGRCGLLRSEVEGRQEVEVGYLLDDSYWGQNLATEATRGIIQLGFERLGLPRLVAFINPLNVASMRVAEKAGMRYERDVAYKSHGSVMLYAIEAP